MVFRVQHTKMAFKLQLLVFFLVIASTFFAVLMMLFQIIRSPLKALSKKKRQIPPACLTDPALGTHEYVTANGIKFHYVTAGDKTKPLMLFLHGFPEFWFSWRYQIKEFSKDYHVVALDLRGYGESEKPPKKRDYSLQALKQDVVELIPALGHEKCILVGHDWGGVIAWRVVHRYPDLVEKFIVMNCPHGSVFKAECLSRWSGILRFWYMFFFQVPCLPEFLMGMTDYIAFEEMYGGSRGGVKNKDMISDEIIEAFKYTFGQPGALTPPINYYRNLFNDTEKKGSSGGFKPIELPTLIVWGDSDVVLVPELADKHDSVCSDVTVRHIPNCSHWVQQDNPKLVNQYMREFLSTEK